MTTCKLAVERYGLGSFLGKAYLTAETHGGYVRVEDYATLQLKLESMQAEMSELKQSTMFAAGYRLGRDANDAGHTVRLQKELEALQAECDQLRNDAERLDWIEYQAKKSPTGISFDYQKYVEDGYVLEHGFRLMRRHFTSGFKDNIRKAIDEAIAWDQL